MEWLLSNGDVVQIVAIAVICGFIGFAVKQGSGNNEKVVRWIPVIVGAAGGVLGLVYKLVSPEYAGMDVFMAVASGIVSGLASTGAHQVIKQSAKASGSADEDDEGGGA